MKLTCAMLLAVILARHSSAAAPGGAADSGSCSPLCPVRQPLLVGMHKIWNGRRSRGWGGGSMDPTPAGTSGG